MTDLLRRSLATKKSRIATIVAMTGLSVLATGAFFPKMEYLPQGNRNLVLSILVPPPGLSYEERHAMGEHLFSLAKPHMNEAKDGFPGIKEMFYVSGVV